MKNKFLGTVSGRDMKNPYKKINLKTEIKKILTKKNYFKLSLWSWTSIWTNEKKTNWSCSILNDKKEIIDYITAKDKNIKINNYLIIMAGGKGKDWCL